MLRKALCVAALLGVTFGGWGDPLRDLGVSGYDCGAELMRPSKTIPNNVNSVRPADIKVVMALGDSITAANGAGAEDPLAVVLQYRGLAFAAGGDKTLEDHVTIPNILKKYNPKLFGYSMGIGGQMVWEVAQLNLAYPGANAKDLLGQAQDLVSKLNAHQEVNMKEDWKLLNIFIGGNDMCGYCRHPEYAPATCVDHIKETVQYVQANIPRTIVNLVTMLHLELLRQVDSGKMFCIDLHTDECGCEQNQNYTNAQIAQACEEYQRLELQLQDSGMFDTKDDFTYVVQPFFNEITTPPEYPNGTVDLEFFCPDCFHFSQYGHAITATWYWKNMMEPVGAKTTKGDFSNPAIPLACPDPKCPFIRTVKNSKDCTPYLTD